MATFRAIHSVGASLVAFLRNAYPNELRAEFAFDFRLLSGGELAAEEEIDQILSLFLYRVTIDEHLRNTPRPNDLIGRNVPMAVNLHYLLTAWSTNAEAEQTVLAWVMRQLHEHPVLDRSYLSTDGGWAADDVIQLIPADLSNEDIMRVWDALRPSYRLSVSYIARVVRIDGQRTPDARPVVASRFSMEDLGVTP